MLTERIYDLPYIKILDFALEIRHNWKDVGN